MRRQSCVGVVCVAVFAMSFAAGLAAGSGQQAGATQAASKAASASPELVGALSKELGSTPEQAAGAAGALFGVAKSRLKADEFGQVSNAVPGMDLLLKAAPQGGGKDPVGLASLSKMAGGASGLASAASAFSKLGLSPDMVAKAVPVVTSFVTKSGGAGVGNLLAGVLK